MPSRRGRGGAAGGGPAQLPLFYPDVRGQTIQEAFDAFHAANPWVYGELVKMAKLMAGRGRRHLGIKMFVEVLRWNYYRQTIDQNSTFRINDHYTSRYVRLIVAAEPALADVFELRQLRAA